MNQITEEKEWVFGLDIGTRNVVGVLGYEEEKKLHIAYTALIEHKTRAMLDGQIHDIDKVTEVVRKLKSELESTSKLDLKDVAIAAAGRVLKTKVAEAVIQFKEDKTIMKSHVHTLGLQGVETAKQMLFDENSSTLDYYCVAHSTIKYYLDDYEIENLLGHKGKELRAIIIATFLPRQVIDSLYSAVEGAGLSVSHLTLEPISAINVSIPKEIRMLNLALVDVGAGTSDIAITKDGSITAYGMLPFAGDEFSEKLVEEYLIDFDTAEMIKKRLSLDEKIEFIDILGLKQSISVKDILSKLEETLDKITTDIANKITELNGGIPPKAVFCVGGGSQFPLLLEKLAKRLEISNERVIIKDVSSTSEENLHYDIDIKGPEYITPVGICLTSWMNSRISFINVRINGVKTKLLNSKMLTVMDAAIKGNFNSNNFILKNGQDLEFTYNNKLIKIQGELGEAAKIVINDKNGDLMSTIYNDDEIILSPAYNGKDASLIVGELTKDMKDKKIFFGGKIINITVVVNVNGEKTSENYQVRNGDFITTNTIDSLSDVLEYLQIKHNNFDFYINGSISQLKTLVNDNDRIELVLKQDSQEKANENEDFIVYVNKKPIKLLGKESYIFVDIFNFIDFNSNEGKGNINLKLNGTKAAYTDGLKPQDKIEIYWQ
ncbi:cell division protein FtsA [Alkalibaculum sp. M08DMB]|uniref:Cell division protein FtsA n=1 Tax=Alkalibaculum sporogenes TaxID=2655001 RepID=A0A6A7KCQ0_9FIRM|nr:pilus assembly protein PilM [Alkalibaculum sporogenes]MPW26783.1 cell division protein FtsA [Alkalibaculum sporogenes]